MALPQALQYIIVPPFAMRYGNCGENVPRSRGRPPGGSKSGSFLRIYAALFHGCSWIRADSFSAGTKMQDQSQRQRTRVSAPHGLVLTAGAEEGPGFAVG